MTVVFARTLNKSNWNSLVLLLRLNGSSRVYGIHVLVKTNCMQIFWLMRVIIERHVHGRRRAEHSVEIFKIRLKFNLNVSLKTKSWMTRAASMNDHWLKNKTLKLSLIAQINFKTNKLRLIILYSEFPASHSKTSIHFRCKSSVFMHSTESRRLVTAVRPLKPSDLISKQFYWISK